MNKILTVDEKVFDLMEYKDLIEIILENHIESDFECISETRRHVNNVIKNNQKQIREFLKSWKV